jgi:hypothetical protein
MTWAMVGRTFAGSLRSNRFAIQSASDSSR